MEYQFDNTREPVRQGDVYLVPIMAVPEGADAEKAQNGHFILGHSETGHHHIMKERPDVKLFSGMDTLTGFLSLSEEALMEHLRNHDTHGSISIPAGDYLIKRGREHGPEGWRRAAD